MNEDKIILSVYIPAENRTVEARVSRGMKVSVVTELLKEMIMRRESDYIPDGTVVLCERKSGAIMNPNSYIVDWGLGNGSELIII